MATTAGDLCMYDRAYKNDRHLAGDRNAARERARCCHTTGVVCPLAGTTTELTLHIPVYHGRPPLPHRPPVVRVRVLHGGDSTSAPEFDESQNMIRTVPTMRLRYGPIQRAGPFLLAIEVDGAHVMGSPFSLHCRPGAAVANKSSFDAAAYTVRAGEPAHLMFTCRDSFGNRCHEGGALVTVHNASPEDDPDALGASAPPDTPTLGPQEGALHVLDRGDGSYAAVVTHRRTGMRCFHGCVNGIAVARPVRLHVQPAPLHAPNCVPYGDAFECFVAAGVPAILKLQARDVYGNVIESGGRNWETKLEYREREGGMWCEAERAPSVRDGAGAGEYAVSLCAPRAGPARVLLRPLLNGIPVPELFTLALMVCPSPEDPGSFRLAGAALRVAVAGEPAELRLRPR